MSATADPGLPAGFSVPTREWFAGAFEAPTAAQAGAWEAISAGDHALVVAPTGSGKTLAAFLWSLDRLLTAGPPADRQHRCRVLYVSPLKALATDVERNLHAPLVGIRQVAERRGTPLPEVAVGLRTGDTPQAQRRAFAARPPDVLITTPESLFLVLTSAARAGLAGVGTVIVDEIHAVAGTKRGAHLAVSLERLDAFLEQHGGPAQRIGLSATVRPVDAVAGFLAGARTSADGGRRVRVVQPAAAKQVEVDVVVPVPDLSDLGGTPVPAGDATTAGPGRGPSGPAGAPDLSGAAAARPRRPSIWPHVEERVVDLVAEHRSTLVFANSRRGAERLTARMNEVWAARQGADLADHGSLVAAEAPGQSGTAVGAPTLLARAHHGSMSRDERTRTEDELKSGRLPAVVATSSLELGIDMGSVDLVVQVGAPPSVASGLQRIGRAGHQVGAVSHGVVFPTFRGELVPAAVVAERMRAGAIEELHVPANPLDVLAQQVVAMVAVDDWDLDELARVVRRAAPFTGLGDGALRAVLDMLAGRYPSEEFAELRPRLVWDRATGLLRGRPGALRLAATSGGTIPDRGLYGVFLAGSEREGTVSGGLRVGELDEEMVHESRAGDTFTLGSSTWRIEEITPDRVLVTPAPGRPGRLPFWKGDGLGRPLELGRAVGAWLREAAALPRDEAAARARAAGLDEWAADNLVAYLAEQREATGRVPDDATVVVERFRDELGDWRVVVHSPFGAQVHAPWALVIAGRLRERYGLDAAVMHSDDGIVLRLPDAVSSGEATWDTVSGSWSTPQAPQVDLADLLLAPDEVADAVRAELGASTIFAARFREAAGRALLLPRRRPDRRQPLWQQRQRAAQLLQVAAGHPEFPILLEAARECLQDDFDTAGLAALMADVTARRVQVVEVTTPTPSPFAQSLLFGYTAQFLYDGDAPLAERRAAALTLDPALLAELLAGDATPLADLLDPAAVLAVEAEVGGTAPDRLAADLEQVADVLRRHGPLDLAAALERTAPQARDALPGWLSTLVGQRRVLQVRCAGTEQWAVVEDAARLRDALGVALPPGVPAELAAPVDDPLGDLVRRHARTHGPFTTAQVAQRFALPPAAVGEVLRRLERDGAIVVGRLRPEVLGGTGEDHCDVEVLRRIRRRSLAALRAEVEPVPAAALGRFLPAWQHVAGVEVTGGRPVAAGHALRGVDGLARVVEQLAGYPVPASALESLVLPSRVVDYTPTMLDELTAAGEVLWAGHASLAARDGLVSLHPAATADLTLPAPLVPPASPLHDALRTALAAGGGWFLDPLVARVEELTGDPANHAAVIEALWDLAWCGQVTNDGFGPVRARLGATGRGTTHRTRPSTPRGRALRPGLALRPTGGTSGPARDAAGRWSLLPTRETDPTLLARAAAAQLLDRHGVVTRAVAPTEGVAGRFGQVYRVLTALEESGAVRRGYFVEHLGGSQFALPGAVDQLRATEERRAVVLAATDPANPFGAALPWPAGFTAHRPGRTAGALVVLVDGDLAWYLERGGRTVLSFTGDRDETDAAAHLGAGALALAHLVRTGRLGRVALRRLDGAEVLDREVLAGPAARALADAGFATTPRGLRL